jgi:RNA polymerase sigma-70 factor (ECF subfamily)
MTESLMAMLRRLLVADYGALKLRLARRFGSADFAGEVLHEAWLHLNRSEAGVVEDSVRNPTAYLYRLAVNIAVDQKRAESRWFAKADVESFCRQAVNELDPSRVAEARSELATLARALEDIPPRRRAIFLASRLHSLSHKEIAERYGVTVRIVDRELKAALDHFSEVLEKKMTPRRGPRSLKTS